jgi:hypothetical protein
VSVVALLAVVARQIDANLIRAGLAVIAFVVGTAVLTNEPEPHTAYTTGFFHACVVDKILAGGAHEVNAGPVFTALVSVAVVVGSASCG